MTGEVAALRDGTHERRPEYIEGFGETITTYRAPACSRPWNRIQIEVKDRCSGSCARVGVLSLLGWRWDLFFDAFPQVVDGFLHGPASGVLAIGPEGLPGFRVQHR